MGEEGGKRCAGALGGGDLWCHGEKRQRGPAALDDGLMDTPDTVPGLRAEATAFHPAARLRLLNAIRFDDRGLVPVIAQQHDTGEVLMLAWMSREAVAETLATGRVTYFSRSRSALWRKGETSGQVQRLVELRLDCDGDTLLALVDQTGVACHTGRRNCFFQALRGGELVSISEPRTPR